MDQLEHHHDDFQEYNNSHHAIVAKAQSELEVLALHYFDERETSFDWTPAFPPATLQILRLMPGNQVCVDCGGHYDFPNPRRSPFSTTIQPMHACVVFGTLLCRTCALSHLERGLGAENQIIDLIHGYWSLPNILAMLEGGNERFRSFCAITGAFPSIEKNYSTHGAWYQTLYEHQACRVYKDKLEKAVGRTLNRFAPKPPKIRWKIFDNTEIDELYLPSPQICMRDIDVLTVSEWIQFNQGGNAASRIREQRVDRDSDHSEGSRRCSRSSRLEDELYSSSQSTQSSSTPSNVDVAGFDQMSLSNTELKIKMKTAEVSQRSRRSIHTESTLSDTAHYPFPAEKVKRRETTNGGFPSLASTSFAVMKIKAKLKEVSQRSSRTVSTAELSQESERHSSVASPFSAKVAAMRIKKSIQERKQLDPAEVYPKRQCGFGREVPTTVNTNKKSIGDVHFPPSIANHRVAQNNSSLVEHPFRLSAEGKQHNGDSNSFDVPDSPIQMTAGNGTLEDTQYVGDGSLPVPQEQLLLTSQPFKVGRTDTRGPQGDAMTDDNMKFGIGDDCIEYSSSSLSLEFLTPTELERTNAVESNRFLLLEGAASDKRNNSVNSITCMNGQMEASTEEIGLVDQEGSGQMSNQSFGVGPFFEKNLSPGGLEKELQKAPRAPSFDSLENLDNSFVHLSKTMPKEEADDEAECS